VEDGGKLAKDGGACEWVVGGRREARKVGNRERKILHGVNPRIIYIGIRVVELFLKGMESERH